MIIRRPALWPAFSATAENDVTQLAVYPGPWAIPGNNPANVREFAG